MIKQNSTGRIIRMNELVDKVGYAKSTIHALVKDGRFPPPFKLTPNGRAIGWFEETIDQWLQEMARAAYATHIGKGAGSNGAKK